MAKSFPARTALWLVLPCALLLDVFPQSWGLTRQLAAAPQSIIAQRHLQENAGDEKNNTQTQTAVAQPAEAPPAAQPTPKSPEFVRVLKQDNKPQALQTAAVTYRKPGDESEVAVTLIGAVHIGEPEYYSELNQLFHSFDALLYELVADPAMGIPDPEERGVSPISTIQVGLKDTLELSFQLDQIDYKAKNFVHADMNPEEFFQTMEARKEGLLQMLFRSMGSGLAMQSSGKSSDLEVLAALVSTDRARGLRRAFAEQMEMMEGQMAALTGEDGKSTLITERNAKAFEVLDREIKAGKKKLGIFYGAGHLKDMHERLVNDYGMEIVETKWLDAWDLR